MLTTLYSDFVVFYFPLRTPQCESTPLRSNVEVAQKATEDPSSYVQEALGSVWKQVIGDIELQIDVSQLQVLIIQNVV